MTLPQPESARGAGGFRVVKAPPAHAGPFAGYPDLLTIGHMQEITGLSNQTLRTSCASGQIPAVKIGRRWFVFVNKEIDISLCRFSTLRWQAPTHLPS